MAMAALAAAFLLIPPWNEPGLDPNRILVVPLENRTGDASLDPVGAMAAEWLTEGLLALTGIVQPVPNEQVMGLLRGQAGESTAPEANTRRLAHATGAGTVVSGGYYLHGDSLEFQAQVMDVSGGAILGASEPVRGPVQDPGIPIGLLRRRVTSIVAARFEPLMQVEIPDFERPPTYEAYQAYLAGMRAFVDGDWAEALRHLERASELDTTYVRAMVVAIPVYSNLGRPAVAESLAAEILRSSEGLSPYDRLRTEYLLANVRGDRLGAYRAARAAVEMVPGGSIHYGAMNAAVSVNRPREALEIAERLHIPQGAGPAPLFYFEGIASAHHLLGEHREELAIAALGRGHWPGLLPAMAYEVRALAALGDVHRLREDVEECLTLRPERGWSPGDVIRTAALELDIHGHSAEAREILRRAYEWHESQSPDEAEAEPGRFDLAQTRYFGGELEEAERLFAGLAGDFPGSVEYLGYLGAIAARRGNREEAERISRALNDFEQPYIGGQHTLWRARIASLLGNRDEALALLRGAVGQGVRYGPDLHADPDLKPLRGYPPYQEFMRPKG